MRETRDAEVEAARAAQAQAEAERDEAVRARDAAVKARKKAVAERDKAAEQLQAIRDDVEALGPNGYGIDWDSGHEPSLREVRERVADARDELHGARNELHGVYRDIDQAREDLEVTTGRRTLGLRDVVASVIDVVAGALEDSGFPKVAAWLRRRADELTEKAVDEIAPETRTAHRALADMPDGLDVSSTGIDYTRSPSGPDV